MPCGALWSHADGTDFRRNMRSKILCISVLCANISHAKAQSLAKSAWGGLTQKTRKTHRILLSRSDFFFNLLFRFFHAEKINFHAEKKKGNNIEVDPYRIYACIAPVGGRTCLTAGERSEPAD